ncbi:hypothetical protein GGI15_004671 [Coemansia interrupta]|uniref:DH domain-containing protein n=1 Tax=Coemansia interrupta TaxID=1126814 RepID=A0A9W8LDE1_9FUNG|nr:hypothetical protein GGI15_004671 [Coemansia interrupta]
MKPLSNATIDTAASLSTATPPYSPTLLSQHASLDASQQQQQQQQQPTDSQQPRRSVFLDYSGYRLAEVPREIPHDVISLSLSRNMLTQIPPSFGRTFAMLQSLDISGNQIVVLPEEISHLQSLRELNASRNALIGLPITIGSLRNLEVLDLSENYIIALDASMPRLESLRMLNISDNRLVTLPSYLGLLAHNLRILLVDGNPFYRSQRDLIEPILTVSSKEAKRIAKAKEKSEKMRERAVRRGETMRDGSANSMPLHSLEYTIALKKLITVRLRRNRKQSIVVPSAAVSNNTSTTATSPNVQRSKSQMRLRFDGKNIVEDHPLPMLSPLPSLGGSKQLQVRESAVLPLDTVTQHISCLSIDAAAISRSTTMALDGPQRGTAPPSGTRKAGVIWDSSIPHSAELNEYMTRQLPPLPVPDGEASHLPATPMPSEPAACASAPVSATVPPVAAQNTSASAQGYDQGPIPMPRYSSAINTVATANTTSSFGLNGRLSISSTSQDSHSSSMEDSIGLIQDATKVSKVLWQLRDEWDLDPRHSETDSVTNMLAQLREGNVRVDGASEIDRAYREKAPTAGSSQRLKILSELLVTEVTYVDTLKNVVGIYLNPMREAKILSESELREIFSNIEVILAFHNDHFLPSVTYAISQPDAAIGNVFLHHGAHFKLYSMYTNNHETSVKTLSTAMSRRAMSNFIQSARGDVTQLGQVGLDGHLLTPVQRLPRYRMLLLDLLSNTPAEHPDHELLYEALKDLNKTIYEVNEKKRVFENQARLHRIQDKVAGASEIPLIMPHRVFKLMANFRLQIFSEHVVDRSGVLTVRRIGVGTVYRFFLFNDMLLQCTIIMNKDLRVNHIYKLRSRVTPAEITGDNELRIVDNEGILYLKGDISDVRKWAHAINGRLEN